MHGMMKFFSNFKEFYNDINGATLTGAIDVIVVEQPDGTYNCSPFHVRFGKLGVLRSREKVVDIEINGEPQEIHMKLGESGEAFFVEELLDDDDNDIPDHLATSPIPVSEFENMFKSQGRRRSFNLDDMSALNAEPNDYTKRRYTADNESNKTLERNFIKRQIGLGNLDIHENSTEDITLSIASNKPSSEDLSKSNNDISETIFKMDSLDENSREERTPITPSVRNGESKSSKKKKKKMRKKNAPRKSNSGGQMTTSQTLENLERTNEEVTDRSSLDSRGSDTELKDLSKLGRDEKDGLLVDEPSNYKKIDADFHFFSDTELTANGNIDSRTGSPVHIETVQSDSELEVKFRSKEELDEPPKSWEWGGFPIISPTTSPTNENPTKDEHKSMLSGMFSFMKSKHGTQNHLEGGMYLSDITSGEIDQGVAEIYFSQKKKEQENADIEMDCESGNGPSLAQSPNSAEGCKSIDSDFEDQTKLMQSYSQDVSLSLCGWDPSPNTHRFQENAVNFSDLCNNPILLENPNLVVCIKQKYYTWKVAAPLIASIMIFGRPLVQSSVDMLCSTYMPHQDNRDGEKSQPQEQRYSWWNWRRPRTSREATPAKEDPAIVHKATEIKETTIKEVVEEAEQKTEVVVPVTEAATETVTLTVSESVEQNLSISGKSSNSDKCKKTLRLSSKQIASLNLRDGMNEVEFSVTTAYQGTTRCQCHLYKWKWDDKIVISDIDGTITKSDVLGHILPIVGKDWAQSGVAQLFNKIKDNGYKLLYLSARAIGQARITREYLKSIRQGNLNMPDGPILLNPTSLITAFHREVIEKKPEQFKIQCMSDIKALFPTDSNPFYAGYGNRINDVWAYRAVGIPIVRIFTINPKGELKHELTQTFQSSYSGQCLVVDDVFPPLLHKSYAEKSIDDDDSDFSDSESSSVAEN